MEKVSSKITTPAKDGTTNNTEGNNMKYKVVLVAEDGEYTITGAMSFSSAVRFCKDNAKHYGEGQHLYIEVA